jgi:response regulator RpfG family c-di-GMP phosphodiesterase
MKEAFNFLIIDDDRYSNTICKMIIKKFLNALDIKDFEMPHEGLAYVKDTLLTPQPARTIMFLDINMPLMSGWELLEELGKMENNFADVYQVYMLSSSVNEYDLGLARDNKFVIDYLVKPLMKEQVIEVFSKY